MASGVCSKCGTEWFWDTCHDALVKENGAGCVIAELKHSTIEDDSNFEMLTVMKCTCGRILTASIDGQFFFDCEEFEGITWA